MPMAWKPYDTDSDDEQTPTLVTGVGLPFFIVQMNLPFEYTIL